MRAEAQRGRLGTFPAAFGDFETAPYSQAQHPGVHPPSSSEAAAAAVGTSGYYVRHAASPALPQFTEFLAAQVG